MGKTATFSGNLLKLVLNATAFANIADNAASSPNTNTYVSGHTSAPATDFQNSNETSYTSYARQAVARTTGGWTISSNVANPVANIVFPVSTGGTPTLTHFGVGKAVSGSTDLWWWGTITPNIVVSTSVVQTITTGSTITET